MSWQSKLHRFIEGLIFAVAVSAIFAMLFGVIANVTARDLQTSGDASGAIRWEAKQGIWQISAQGFIIALMVILASLSIHNNRVKIGLDVTAFFLWVIALMLLIWPLIM